MNQFQEYCWFQFLALMVLATLCILPTPWCLYKTRRAIDPAGWWILLVALLLIALVCVLLGYDYWVCSRHPLTAFIRCCK